MAELTTKEASEKYGLSGGYLCRLLRRGTLKGRKIADIWVIDEASLRRYLARPRKPGPKPKSGPKPK